MKSAGNWIKRRNLHVGHFKQQFGSVLWTPPNKTSEVSTGHFQTIIWKCPSHVRNGLDTSEPLFGSVPAVVDTSEVLFGSVLHIHCLTWGPNCLPGVFSWDLGLSNIFGCWLVNYCGELIRWILWHTVVHLGRSTMPGWYKACGIGKCEQQVWFNICWWQSSGYTFG